MVSLCLEDTAMYSKFYIEKNTFDIPIWKEYLKCLPFGRLQSRHSVAVVLSYVGTNDIVYEMMRKTSHKTRAYITNADGLKGFLVNISVTSAMRNLAQNRNGELSKALRHHQVNIWQLINQLSLMKTQEQRVELLRE